MTPETVTQLLRRRAGERAEMNKFEYEHNKDAYECDKEDWWKR